MTETAPTRKKNFGESTDHRTGSAGKKIKIPSARATTWAKPREKILDGRASTWGRAKGKNSLAASLQNPVNSGQMRSPVDLRREGRRRDFSQRGQFRTFPDTRGRV